MVNVISFTRKGLTEHPYFKNMRDGSVDDLFKGLNNRKTAANEAKINTYFQFKLVQAVRLYQSCENIDAKDRLQSEIDHYQAVLKAREIVTIKTEPASIKDFARATAQFEGLELAQQPHDIIETRLKQAIDDDLAYQFIAENGGQNFCNFFTGFVQGNIAPVIKRRVIDETAKDEYHYLSLLSPTFSRGVWRKVSPTEYNLYITVVFGYAVAGAAEGDGSGIYGIFKKVDDDHFHYVEDKDRKDILRALPKPDEDPQKINAQYEEPVVMHAVVNLNTNSQELQFKFDKFDIYANSNQILYIEQLNAEKIELKYDNAWALFDYIASNRAWYTNYRIDKKTLTENKQQFPPDPKKQIEAGYFWWPQWATWDWWYGANESTPTVVKRMVV